MSEKRISRIIECIGQRLEKTVSDMTTQQGETGPVLSATLPSPYEEDKSVGYTISIFDGGNGFLLTDIMYIPFVNVPKALHENLNRLICVLNTGMVMGNYVMLTENSAVVFNLGAYSDSSMSEELIAQKAMDNIELIKYQTSAAGTVLHGFISGKYTYDEALESFFEEGGY